MTFDDGIVKIYSVTNGSEPGEVPAKVLASPVLFYFHEESLGITRYFEAIKAGQLIERVISVPWPADININQIAVFEDGSQFKIRMVQQEKDEEGLKIVKLSLERNGEEYEITE